jgi:chromosome segregation ATPase
MLLLERRAAELDSTLGSERTRVIALQGEKDLLRGEVAHWRDEAARHRDRARRIEARLTAQHEQVQELLAAVDLLERAAG